MPVEYTANSIFGGTAGGGASPLIFNQIRLNRTTAQINNGDYLVLPLYPLNLFFTFNDVGPSDFPAFGWFIQWSQNPGDVISLPLTVMGASSQTAFINVGSTLLNQYSQGILPTLVWPTYSPATLMNFNVVVTFFKIIV